jgi:hypothetical protein
MPKPPVSVGYAQTLLRHFGKPPYTPATVAGTYRQRHTLTSGRFAMIDSGLRAGPRLLV